MAYPVEVLKEEYLAQMRGIFPLHRVILLAISVVIVVASKNPQFKSVGESLLNVTLRSIADLEKGFFSGVTVQDGLLAIALLFIGSALHFFVRNVTFSILKKRIRLKEIVASMTAKTVEANDGSAESYLLLKRSESESARWAKKVSSLSSLSQSATTLSVALCFAGYFGNLVDLGVAIAFLVAAVLIQAQSFLIFLRSYLPYAVHLRGLAGLGSDISLP